VRCSGLFTSPIAGSDSTLQLSTFVLKQDASALKSSFQAETKSKDKLRDGEPRPILDFEDLENSTRWAATMFWFSKYRIICSVRFVEHFTIMLVLVLVLVAACQEIPSKATNVSTSQDFLATWEAQLDKYRSDFSAKDAILREKSAEPIQADLASSADPWNMLVGRVSELSAMITEEYVIAGRGQMIKEFIKHMETHPSAGISDVWFLRQGEDVQNAARDFDANSKAFFSTFDQRATADMKWILEFGELAKEQGIVEGKIQELKSLHEQAMSYYLEMQQVETAGRYASEQKARATEDAFRTLSALGQYYNQSNFQQQMLNSLNRPRTCSFFQNTMTCQ
jgi:hypothetical protein